MKKIYLVKHECFHAPHYYWSICINITQYSFAPETELFKYHQSIMVQREVSWLEAFNLLHLVKTNGTGDVCGGKALEIIELLQPENTVENLLKVRETIEDQIRSIDPEALINYELEQLSKLPSFVDDDNYYDRSSPELKRRTRTRLIEVAQAGMVELGDAQFGVPGVMSGLYLEKVWSYSDKDWKEYMDWAKNLINGVATG